MEIQKGRPASITGCWTRFQILILWKSPVRQGLAARVAMASCPKGQYWDSLSKTCISCAVTCSQRSQRTCTDFCKFLSCRKEQGKYYDHLLGACVSCDSTCTQHPQQCAHFCEKRARSQANLQPEFRRPWAGEVEARPDTSGRHQGAEHGGLQEGPGLKLSSDLVLVYSILGLCLCAIFCCFLVAVACFLRRRGEPLPSQRAGSCRSQAKSPHRPATEARSEVVLPPQPVETCSFCFPERGSPTQESARALGMLGFAGTATQQPCELASVGGLGVLRVPTGDTRPGA
ncbi:tumor necrosis factor receptor superfamily member 13B [Acomys russatus]|uniref:tumor necrosis factor receptor superfamily member 13B n=1 Tax=Acomys russatus TaxID=60746 RepID=UPI0021E2B7CB|nr:tumor necrosis factor receptor superfamily member 13B [Acomys russatus]